MTEQPTIQQSDLEEIECEHCAHFLSHVNSGRLLKALRGSLIFSIHRNGPIDTTDISPTVSHLYQGVHNYLKRQGNHFKATEVRKKKTKACPTPDKVARRSFDDIETKRLSLPKADELVSYACRCGRWHMRSKTKMVTIAESERFKCVIPHPSKTHLWYVSYDNKKEPKIIEMDSETALQFAHFVLEALDDSDEEE